jgi:diaminohydroxyphosphoribosylaminopyrimidine deaminase / 5-amino-6-(5-phosphoribosylamino)uracil reductase
VSSEAEQAAMSRALELARRGGSHPNPSVGAVILDAGGTVLAEGVTDRWPGTAHAERAALEATLDARGATLVVTLEPCDHTGRSSPCTEAIVAAGIARVVVGSIDPDPRVSGAGIARLRAAGVEVETGLMAEAVERADPAYFHHRRTGRPRFTVKTAMTVDGQTAAADGTSRWITSQESRRDGHGLRSVSDAVMVGAGTFIADDPELTVRDVAHAGPQPRAVVIGGHRPLPTGARLWGRPDTLVYASRPLDLPVEVAVVDAPGGRLDLGAVAADLAGRGILAVLVEGGAALVGSLWRSGMIDAGVTYVGAVVAGGAGAPPVGGTWETLADARRVDITGMERVGPDLRVDWAPALRDDRGDR